MLHSRTRGEMNMADQLQSKELEALFVDDSEQAIDSVLRSCLEPIIGFTREGKLVTKAPFLKLSDSARILAVLLARQAMSRLRLHGARSEATAEELASDCAIPTKSCREYLSRFKTRRLLEKSEAGYFVPVWAIAEVAETVRSKRSD